MSDKQQKKDKPPKKQKKDDDEKDRRDSRDTELEPKTSKSKLSEEFEVLDLSLKKKRTGMETSVAREKLRAYWDKIEDLLPFIEIPPKPAETDYPWGCVQFYEGSKAVFMQELRGEHPIAINVDSIVYSKTPQPEYDDAPFPNPNMTYNDWQHVIGKKKKQHVFNLRKKIKI